MHMETGRPDRRRGQLEAFLAGCGLDFDARAEYTAMLVDDGEIVAAGSLDGMTVKCVAVAPDRQGEGLAAQVMTELRREAWARGHGQLMLYTKPRNRVMFAELGFSPLAETRDCLLMESGRGGLERFLAGLPGAEGVTGCIVANANPFTLGHRHLIERALDACDTLRVFILSEDKSLFSPDTRMTLARAGCADLSRVSFHFTGPYLVSSATFPDYFLRDRQIVDRAFCELDVAVFGERIAPKMGITRRFVGTEPEDGVTRQYNECLKARLPGYGVEVVELPRREADGQVISAGRVRALYRAGRLEEIRPLTPETTYEYLRQNPYREG